MTALETMATILAANEDPAWSLAVDGFDPMMESSVESRFTISNGFLGVRGARSTTRGERWVVPARTYVAGLFDSPSVQQATQALVPAADCLCIRIVLPDGPLVVHPGDVPLHRMTLDMRRGALLGESHHLSTPDIGLCVRTLCLVSMSDRAVPSVPMMLRQRPAGSLPLRAEVTASNGYAPFE
jgi:trehalose/maltose hydrolase-like predicted phosphorylase